MRRRELQVLALLLPATVMALVVEQRLCRGGRPLFSERRPYFNEPTTEEKSKTRVVNDKQVDSPKEKVKIITKFCGPPEIGERDPFGVKWEKAIRAAMLGEDGMLEVAASEATWETPLRSDPSTLVYAQGIKEMADFFEKPRYDVLTVLKGSVTIVRWRLSATWPVPWRPRIKVYGESKVTLEKGLAISVEETWLNGAGPLDIVFGQTLPNFWDVYELFSTPAAERPSEIRRPVNKNLADILKPSFEIVTQLPMTVKRISFIDVTNSRSQRLASGLPDFAFSKFPSGLMLSRLIASSPLTVSVALLEEPINGKPARKVQWDVLVPSVFLPEELPVLDAEPETRYLEEQWIEKPTVEYINLPERYFMVAKYDGDVQDPEAEPLRQALLERAQEAGFRVMTEIGLKRPPVLVKSKAAKVGFDTEGHVIVAAYLPRLSFIPIDRSELAIELESPESSQH